MTALPAKTSFTDAAVTQEGFKQALDDLRDFLDGLFDDTGLKADARTQLSLGSAALLNEGTGTSDLPDNARVASLISGSNTGLIESGTRMIFYQSTAPVGWTLYPGVSDRLLRVINSGTVGSGGSWTISGLTATTGNDGSHNHGGSTGSHTLTTSQIPSHRHNNGIGDDHNPPDSANIFVYGATTADMPGQANTGVDTSESPIYQGLTSLTGGGSGHSHTIPTQGDHNHSVTVSSAGTWKPRYIDVIICTKDA